MMRLSCPALLDDCRRSRYRAAVVGNDHTVAVLALDLTNTNEGRTREVRVRSRPARPDL
jgi:hypothetical protein